MGQKDYTVDDIVKEILKLGNWGLGHGCIVGNKTIYEQVTGLKRFSRKQWELLKPILRQIAKQRFFEVAGVSYQMSWYNPMLASKYNFRLNPDAKLLGSIDYVAGFSTFRQERQRSEAER